MYNKSFIYFLLLFICTVIYSCTNSFTHIKPKLYVSDNDITVVGDSSASFNLIVKIEETISYEKQVKTNDPISFLSLLKERKDLYYDIALLLAKKKGNIKVNLAIPDNCDTTVVVKLNMNDTNEYNATVITGICAKLAGNFDASNVEPDIIKWLYRKNENNLEESTINDMRLYLKELNRTTYKEYIVTGSIPVVESLKGIEYKLSSNLLADHYYLFACNSEKDVEDFVEEMISLKFESSVPSLNQNMSCFRNASTSGIACIVLVGLNNDWSFQIVPIGLICIDNIKPSIGNVINDNNDNHSFNSSTKFTFPHKQIQISSKSQSPIISGRLNVEFGKFEGYGYMLNVPFTFTFEGDVKMVIVHNTKNSTVEIDLTDKASPYHTTLKVGLNTGDNYIPIDAVDACGNKSTYDLNISTERIQKNPVIENNIYN